MLAHTYISHEDTLLKNEFIILGVSLTTVSIRGGSIDFEKVEIAPLNF